MELKQAASIMGKIGGKTTGKTKVRGNSDYYKRIGKMGGEKTWLLKKQKQEIKNGKLFKKQKKVAGS